MTGALLIYDIEISRAWVLLLVLLTDVVIGDPRFLYDRIPHPVAWMGGLLAWLERRGNRTPLSPLPARRAGVFCLALYLALVTVPAYVLNALIFKALSPKMALLALVLISSVFLCSRSLFSHIRAVRSALAGDDLCRARDKVGLIVGRNTSEMDRHDIARATVESLAENFSDGVIAPAFWFLVAGFPGLVFYKAVNTADSMIGHRNARYRYFGWAAARLDDGMNYIPARLTALLMIGAALLTPRASAGGALRVAFRDAPKHRSPNAGWPEAAMAGALGFRLGGPVSYDGETANAPWLGNGRAALADSDIDHAVTLMAVTFELLSFTLLLSGGGSLS